MLQIMMNPKTSDRDKIAAAKDLLDRNGFIGKQELSVDMKISKFDQIAADIVMDVENLGPAPTFDYEDIVDADEVEDDEPKQMRMPTRTDEQMEAYARASVVDEEIALPARKVPAPRTATEDEWAEEQAYHRRNHTPARTDASDPVHPPRKVPSRRSGNVPPKMQSSGDAPRQLGAAQSRRDTVAPPAHPPVEADPNARESDGPRKRSRVTGRRRKA
ncbi:hypothetical protein [Rathayibacter sp. VKM Ac-2754]|uniref:hypothetical protein n=1 Tax=Rathayibacter sp. VKM Ac-2754 TaxID=2609251 RepID=UPI001357B051|nr:hypothetical protein [Rathayibacter sp. VKM Ac-2754]MWV57435.1 hypothetical protein [Rathayibacter sp. VKM Ac-2754]